MSNVAILDNIQHQNLKVKLERGELYGDHVNQVLVFPNEFRELQREYPILFRKSDVGQFHAVALLGLDRDENLYLSETGWRARYIPASQARGPFSIGMQAPKDGSAPAEPKVQIDLDHPALSEDEGFPLFKDQGGYSRYLEHILQILRTVHDGVGLSPAFFETLEKYALIEPITLEVKVSETMQYSVPGVYSISQEKLQDLPADDLAQLHKDGTLAVCYWALASLDNIHKIVDWKRDISQ